MQINNKLKVLGGGLIVLAAASIMLQPLLTYIAGLGRLISFIITAVLIAYLITFVVRKLSSNGCKNPSTTSSGCDNGPEAEPGSTEV
ncbi:MAG: hypothetical protein JSS86_14005 [Cyanobacteria bacterium SZAS LIN-2]|nr:hypothetical protein [Cyanobacteria bacterium SZAS LIN-3]MBS1997428.1 hypothetical protein [Cyanobacteria bacterium SZAS LIN-2]